MVLLTLNIYLVIHLYTVNNMQTFIGERATIKVGLNVTESSLNMITLHFKVQIYL